MTSYSQMDWETLEEHANEIRREIVAIYEDIDLWESRDVNISLKSHYDKIKELSEEIDIIQNWQEKLEARFKD